MQDQPQATLEADPLVRPLHPFTASGMGHAPFRFLGIARIPSPTLAEANPSAYNAALAALPRDLKNGCGSCAHCYTPIMNIFIVQNAAGDKYGVGCDCIEKTADKPLVRASHLAKLKADRARRRAKKESKRLAWLAEVIDPATGETREQALQREAAEKRAAYDAKEAAHFAIRKTNSEALAKWATALRDGNGGFRDSVGQDMQAGFLPRGRALEIASDILGKIFGGRRDSKAYLAAVEEFTNAVASLTDPNA